jgi:acyl-CoA synthetase (AMP-forming)/AMP-acid ligase II
LLASDSSHCIIKPHDSRFNFYCIRYTVSLLNGFAIDAHFGVLAARAILTPINTRLTKPEVSYIIDHSDVKLLLVDHEFMHLVKDSRIRIVVTNDSGRPGDPYEEFLSSGRRFSKERGWFLTTRKGSPYRCGSGYYILGWPGLEAETDENAAAVLCYTSVYYR